MPHREQASEIDDAATIWAAKAERGLTETDRAEFDRWIEGDSRRLGAYVRAQAAWIHAERAAALGQMPEPERSPAVEAAMPEEAQPHGLSRRMMLGGAGAVAAAVAATYVASVNRYRTLESGVGEVRHIALKGGATLTLDTDTRVDIALSSNDRLLDLVRGKLFLHVARSRERPLIVRTGDLILETAGGAFGLQSLLKAPIMALVIEGRVLVTQTGGLFGANRMLAIDRGHALTLVPNQTLLPDRIEPVSSAQQAQLLAWRDGMLSFGGDVLADAVRAFDRYSSVRIVVDPGLARQKVTGLFKADDPRGFASAVAASFGGIVTDQGEIIRISAK